MMGKLNLKGQMNVFDFPENDKKGFDVFISYKRTNKNNKITTVIKRIKLWLCIHILFRIGIFAKFDDELFSDWLYKKLISYNPKKYNITSNKIVIFRDDVCRNAGGSQIMEKIKEFGLTNSKYLIVLCSPKSSGEQSMCINDEIDFFYENNQRYNNIVPLVINVLRSKDENEYRKKCYPSKLPLSCDDTNFFNTKWAISQIVATIWGIKDVNKIIKIDKKIKLRRVLFRLFFIVFIFSILFFIFDKYKYEKAKKQETQSQLLSFFANYEVDNGNLPIATLLALEALPKDIQNPERPYVLKAEGMLRICDFFINGNYYEKSTMILDHTSWVSDAKYSADGKKVLTISSNEVIVWDTQNGKKIFTGKGHNGSILNAVFSPNEESIITISSNCIKLWCIKTGNEIKSFDGFASPYANACYSPDGKYIVSFTHEDNIVKIWDAISGDEIASFKGHKFWIMDVNFSPDGRKLLTASQDNTVKLWDIEKQKEELCLQGHRSMVSLAKYSLDGKNILTKSFDHTVKIWNADNGSLIHSFDDHTGVILNAKFSPDNSRILTSSDSTAILWDAKSFMKIATINHKGITFHADFSPDGNYLFTGSYSEVIVSDAKNGNMMSLLNGHKNNVTSVMFSPCGNKIVTSSLDNTAIIWDTKTGSKIVTLNGHSSSIEHAAFNPNNDQIITTSHDLTARLWQIKKEKKDVINKKEQNEQLIFSPNGDFFSLSTGNKIRLFRYNDFDEINLGSIDQLVFGSSNYALAHFPDSIRLFDLTKQISIRSFEKHNSLKFSPDGGKIIILSRRGYKENVDVFEIDEKKYALLFCQQIDSSRVYSTEYSPDGNLILINTSKMKKKGNQYIYTYYKKIFNALDYSFLYELSDTLGHMIKYSPNSELLACASSLVSSPIKVFDIKSGNLLNVLDGCYHIDGFFSQFDFSPDGQKIVSICENGFTLLDSRIKDNKVLRENNAFNNISFSASGKEVIIDNGFGKIEILDINGNRIKELDSEGWSKYIEFIPDELFFTLTSGIYPDSKKRLMKGV